MDKPTEISSIPLGEIFPNPNQPRTVFKQSDLEELAANIRKVGLMQPVIVAPRDGRFMIIAGERRWRACRLAGLSVVPCIVRADLSDSGIQELALAENLLRRDLSPLEEARAYQDFLCRGYTVESLAELLGMKQPHRIAERTRLLRLSPDFQDALSRGILNPSQAYEMSGLSVENQFRLWRAIQDGQCKSYTKLRRLAAALLAQEKQQNLFSSSSLGEREKQSLSKVDRFIDQAGRLIGSITEDDLSVLEEVLKSDAAACADKLDLLSTLCRRVRKSLVANLAKQEVLAA